MARSVQFHPAALLDLETAADWYRKRSDRAAVRFVAELESLITRMENAPEQYPEFHARTRRAVFHHFPFYAVFRFDDRRIEVIAVAHGRRRPGFWTRRLNPASPA